MKDSLLYPVGKISNTGLLLARAIICWLFIWCGLNKLWDWSWATQFVASAGIPFVDYVLYLAIFVEFLGGTMVLLGYRTRVAAAMLLGFLIPVTLVGHQFWLFEGMYGIIQQSHFMANLAIIGGLLLLSVAGPGRYSLDARNWVWIKERDEG
ncbi:MAG: DoxX family protein [Chlamydiia bacterium]|nr:DoxX family protein [Chlamydiia bacterium]